MKKLIFTFSLFAITGLANAQQDGQQPNDDQLQQQAPRETQVQVERAAKVDAVKQQANSETQAEMQAKAKGQTQRQTKAQPVGINPVDTTATPRNRRKKDLSTPKPVMTEEPKARY